ncbi:MAG: hypothetical protein KA313_11260, partial [Pseudarcicella sp.]|nr:hypothetical protein [Pseudarcicella sp.]
NMKKIYTLFLGLSLLACSDEQQVLLDDIKGKWKITSLELYKRTESSTPDSVVDKSVNRFLDFQQCDSDDLNSRVYACVCYYTEGNNRFTLSYGTIIQPSGAGQSINLGPTKEGPVKGNPEWDKVATGLMRNFTTVTKTSNKIEMIAPERGIFSDTTYQKVKMVLSKQ